LFNELIVGFSMPAIMARHAIGPAIFREIFMNRPSERLWSFPERSAKFARVVKNLRQALAAPKKKRPAGRFEVQQGTRAYESGRDPDAVRLTDIRCDTGQAALRAASGAVMRIR